jgi:predicted aminopeptidase
MRRACSAMAAALALAGCGAMDSAGYYWQSASGQLDLVARAKPIPDVIADTDDAALKRRLERVQKMRSFASRELALPDNASYTRYTDLDRPFVVWNVFATPELSLEPRKWCFPVAGCVSYRGYFREAEAQAEAERLRAAGDDVAVSGVPAYSTLGYFDDPVLSTFVRWPEPEVARMIFHELAHQVVYVKDDTQFNESFAVAVEDAGLERWLQANGDAAMQQYRTRSLQQRAAFRDLTQEARTELAAVYASALPDAEKRVHKAQILAAMREGYERAKAGEPGLAGYDRWFGGFGGRGPNNASLASTALYSAQVPAFRALLAQEDGDLPRFYERVRQLAAMPKPERTAALAALAP